MAGIQKIRQKLVDRAYYLSSHAEEEMAADEFERADIEHAIFPLEIPRAHVVDTGVAVNVGKGILDPYPPAPPPDDHAQFGLVVHPSGSRGDLDAIAGSDDRRGRFQEESRHSRHRPPHFGRMVSIVGSDADDLARQPSIPPP